MRSLAALPQKPLKTYCDPADHRCTGRYRIRYTARQRAKHGTGTLDHAAQRLRDRRHTVNQPLHRSLYIWQRFLAKAGSASRFRVLSFDAIADTEFVWILNARSVSPAASPIAAVFSAKASACAPVSASTAFLDSILENRFAKATSSPLTDSFSFVSIPPSPSLSSARCPRCIPPLFEGFFHLGGRA